MIKFEDAEQDMQVHDHNRRWKGVVHSRSGSRSIRGMKVRTIKVQWNNGVMEDFEDKFPDGIELVPFI